MNDFSSNIALKGRGFEPRRYAQEIDRGFSR